VSLKLEVGKYYRTRDGRKAGPLRPFGGNELKFQGPIAGDESDCDYSWRPDGAWGLKGWKPSDRDIVAEWTDEGARQPQAAQDQERETELERLVRVANEGMRAVAAMHNKPELRAQVEWRNKNFEWEPLYGFWSDGEELRIKPRPAAHLKCAQCGRNCKAVNEESRTHCFEPFYVGPHGGLGAAGGMSSDAWKVSLSDDGKELSVGCQKFDAQWAHQLLIDFCKRDCNMSQKGGREIYAGRKGISIDGSTLSWSDADRILAALEKALGQKEAA
jgi:hypothetical protein